VSTVASLIAGKGGSASFAELIGCTAGQVRVWKHRNRIPREHWPEIMQRSTVTLEELLETEPRQSDADRPGAGAAA